MDMMMLGISLIVAIIGIVILHYIIENAVYSATKRAQQPLLEAIERQNRLASMQLYNQGIDRQTISNLNDLGYDINQSMVSTKEREASAAELRQIEEYQNGKRD